MRVRLSTLIFAGRMRAILTRTKIVQDMSTLYRKYHYPRQVLGFRSRIESADIYDSMPCRLSG